MEAIEGSFVLESCFLKGCGCDTPDNIHKDNIGVAGGALKVALPLRRQHTVNRSSSLGQVFNVAQDPEVDGVDNIIGPPAPIRRGPHMVVIPRGAFEAGTTVRQWHQLKLSGARLEKAIKVRGVKIIVRCPFLHRRRIFCDRELQQAWLVPDLNRFHERSYVIASLTPKTLTGVIVESI